eukprot:339525_1
MGQDHPRKRSMLTVPAATQIHPKWLKLSSLPKNFSVGSVIAINGHEFIVTSTKNSNGIFKYNVHQNQFQQFIKYPKRTGHEQQINNITSHGMQQQLHLYHQNIKMIGLKVCKCDSTSIQCWYNSI